ncbi:General transcription factor IIH subunit 5 [Brachionus plicatilis]|uniref:General transcription and DNA repair factor IIH subunit TFB5 n=1 Tax=Brachionus plicatilis TaxID=10195 RepID=A0A3M7Q2R6_BRAPC|nr:General transcription factor IIH subunit 5 [Brachionus plicatilis]
MVKVVKGTLVECDSTMKQFLLYLDEKGEVGGKFVLEDLDETHLLIESDFVERLKEKIDDLMDKHTYAPDK